MLRIKQIIKLLSEMTPFAPYTYKSKSDRKINKFNLILMYPLIISFILLAALIFSYKTDGYFNGSITLYFIYLFYIICNILGIIIMFLPTIQMALYLLNWKKETSNEFIYEIDHDEEYAKKLIIYQEEELLYASFWLQQKINRLNSRVSGFFGEKTAILSLLGLCYSAVHLSIGFDKLGKALTNGALTSDITSLSIMLGLGLLFGLSLGALMLKKIANHKIYLKEIVELAIRLKKDSSNNIHL
ncbi:hypothetical protein ABN078_07605 [Providencia huaxiensis]|uniref:hypothetical protein n=1 Tax=Providencia TaxID=586 RepID=UPI002349AABC|nr:hypothetical protein [Providencia sp. PROV150]